MEVQVPGARRILTIPNVISFVRLACVPVFLWLLVDQDERIMAVVLLAALGATDWVDGYIARHFDQGSDLGKILDPTADRVLLVAGVLALLDVHALPTWVAIVVLVRELVIVGTILVLGALGARSFIAVKWAGKAGTLALMFALPGFLLVDSIHTGRMFVEVATWAFTIGGLALSYYAAWEYVPQARQALAERGK